ncbi:hypothetical protein pb186bvf_007732 [Paramecium bursaria]
MSDVIETLNQEAVKQIDEQKHLSLELLQKAENLLDFSANCGKSIDRNLIITILYNQAVIYQQLWELTKCAKYLDAVIYNLEIITNNEPNQILFIKRLYFLATIKLQLCAILSQQNLHLEASNLAIQAINNLQQMFKISLQYNEQKVSNSQLKSSRQQQGQYIYEEIEFKHELLLRSQQILKIIQNFISDEIISKQEEQQLSAVMKDLFNWKINQEQNEKQFRKKLNINAKIEQRSLIGLLNENEWIEKFNIGTIMQLKPKQYQDICLEGEYLYEFSQRILLEKILLLSIGYFTLATECRFIENEQKIKFQYRKSQIYHLKSLYIGYNIAQSQCPYIEHITRSFQKHYNQNLNPIIEESIDQKLKINSCHLERKDHMKQLMDNLQKRNKTKDWNTGQINTALIQLKQLKEKIQRVKTEEKFSIKRFQTEPSIEDTMDSSRKSIEFRKKQ